MALRYTLLSGIFSYKYVENTGQALAVYFNHNLMMRENKK